MAVQSSLFEQLHRALLAAFPRREMLDELVSLSTDTDLEEIVSRYANQREAVLRLIEWARANRRLEHVVRAAAAARPDNSGLNRAVAELEPYFAAGADLSLPSQTADTTEARRVPCLAPDMPRSFVPRVREFEALVNVVLSPAPIPTKIATAVHGAGGYGKTWLAIALCHDERVTAAFTGGVLWTSLGQTPRVLDELVKWNQALTGEQSTFVDVEQASRQLAELLDQRKCLLVIDDVWDASDMEPFLRGGRTCVRVVTSRRLDLLGGAPRVHLDEMTAAESCQVLQSVLPPGFAIERLKALGRRLGEWPLLLKLAGGMVQKRLDRRDSPEAALTFVERALDKRGVVAFDTRDAKRREEAVTRTVAASRDQLDPADDERFLTLAIFPENTAIPLSTMERLWGLDDVDTAECAQRLDDVALVTLDLQRGVVTLHDVMRAYLEQQQPNAAEIHGRLIAAYEDVLHLPDEYAWRWLPYHLSGADQLERLRELLLRPEWLEAQIRAVGAVALVRAFDFLRGNPVFEHIQRALRLAVPAVLADPNQLCEQLLGRLPGPDAADLEMFQHRLRAAAPVPRFHAKWPNLVGPGSLVQALAHRGAVNGAMVVPDGRLLSWSWDATLRLWDLPTGDARTLTGHTDAVFGALLLPDGRLLSHSRDGTLRVWDLSTGEGTALRGHNDAVWGVILLPDGRFLSWSRDLRLWDVATGTGKSLTGQSSFVTGAQLLPDGRVLSWSHERTSLDVWDLASLERRELRGHDDGVLGALLLPDGKVLSWSRGGTLRVFDVITGDGRSLVGHQWHVQGALALSDSRVVAWSADEKFRLWDLMSGEARPVSGHDDNVTGARLLNAGQVLSWSRDGTLRLWNSTTGDTRVLEGHHDAVRGATVLSDGRIVSWSDDKALRVWNLATGETRTLSGHAEAISGGLILPDQRVLSWGGDRLRIWDLTVPDVRKLSGHDAAVHGALVLGRSHVLSWSADGTLRVWDVATGQARVLMGHTASVTGAQLLADGKALSWSHDRTLRVWDLATGQAQTLAGHQSFIRGATMLSDSSVLSWSFDGTLRTWDLETGEGRRLSRSQRSPVWSASVLPDGRVLSLGFRETTLLISDPATGEERVLKGHTGQVLDALVLSADHLLSWGDDCTPQVWDLVTGEGRKLTPDRMYVISAQLLPDGRVLSIEAGHKIRIWDISAGQGKTLVTHRGPVEGARVFSAGEVVSWSDDGTIVLSDVNTGEQQTFEGHQNAVVRAALVGDGQLITSSLDRSIRLWDIERSSSGVPFYFDAVPRVLLPLSAGELFVGDDLGRVHFLQFIDSSS